MASRSLAQVEWQIIMRLCDYRSLLRLARCSHATLSAASSAFAWGAVLPVILQATRAHLAELLAGSLLRHAPIGLRWCDSAVAAIADKDSKSRSLLNVAAAARDFVLLTSIPRLRSLDARAECFKLTPHQFMELLQLDPCPLGQLEAFYAGCDVTVGGSAQARVPQLVGSEAALKLLAARCPSLRTLHIQVSQHREVHATYFAAMIIALPNLTAIGIHGTMDEVGLQPLIASPPRGLVQLSLRRLQHAAWHPLLSSSTLRSLRHLSLDQVNGRYAQGFSRPLPRIEWTEVFANLTSLRSITLIQCGAIDDILSAMSDVASSSGGSDSASSSLRLLRIVVLDAGLMDVAASFYTHARRMGSPAPTIPQLQRFLATHHPRCQVVIHTEPKERHVAERAFTQFEPKDLDASNAAAEAEWEQAQSRLAELQLGYSNQVQLKIIDSPIRR